MCLVFHYIKRFAPAIWSVDGTDQAGHTGSSCVTWSCADSQLDNKQWHVHHIRISSGVLLGQPEPACADGPE